MRRINKNVVLPQPAAQRGRSNRCLGQHVSDLPRRAEAKVARHLLDRRADPSSKEGISDCPSLL
jgi:hypothetical protein